ncbi:MAG: response regulator transcription factor [Christensenellales bacterium]|jgi:two-component system alkaline phosphatase synthesis response regulator PhoP
MASTVFLVEDDENIRELIRYALGSSGFEAECFETGEAFWDHAQQHTPDLILLDIMLPGISGMDLLQRIRNDKQLSVVPVIFITAKGTEVDKVAGFEMGADDYIVKPFGVLELIARVKAVLRRGGKPVTGQRLQFKDIEMDSGSREVFKGGKKIELTLKEYDLLTCFLENKNRVLTREQLLEKIWGYDFTGETRTVDVHIKTLRQKIGDNSANPIYISTVRGIGYRLSMDEG